MGMADDFRQDFLELVMPLCGMKIPLLISNTVNALWSDGKRPQLHSKKKTALGWEFAFALPAGMTYRTFANAEEAFRDAIGDVTTEMIHVGQLAILKVITNKIGKKYPYDWDARPPKDMLLPFPVGYTHAGLIWEDLAEIPHMLIGGATGQGKSVSIHVIANTFLHLPEPPKIVLIDMKVSEYAYLENHVLLITEQKDANKALLRLVVEMKNRQQVLKNSRCVNIQEYNEAYPPMPYIVLIIDELAELVDEQSQEAIETLLRLCRSTGICIIMATQRPDQHTFKRFGQSKANCLGRLCFSVADAVNSKIILDSSEAASLPDVRGRAIWKLGKTTQVQVPYLTRKEAEAMLYEQSAIRGSKRSADNRHIDGMGSNGHRSITNTALSLLSSLPAQIKQISRAKED
jgi:S-DNA-T family DNA segregation ATPase FtsK/SpoIIIE